ncbi:L,D-transpeptidase [Salipiger sp. PrR002]|uniref:L,D-transpeptidase n=1 Tax=Salipiger sp. PrR002 TaxID=2706489 RepID=UPI0013BD8551|nr:L,D-transpeptidase [Salipiger sp. PrR002]NDW02153.1 L,D-transpeptidase [Salipiger sp. PrR002]NDW59158.1 L,D-transpeptidase [Salipiger sp. PrR004]
MPSRPLRPVPQRGINGPARTDKRTPPLLTRRGLLCLAALSVSPAARAQQLPLEIARMMPGEFTWHPERAPQGAVAVIISLPEQRVHVYRNGVRIAVSTCTTGMEGHETPTGVFTILQKDVDHHSSIYNNAPMPNMQRLTWDGIALHAGNLPGYPASHGCVRLPYAFSKLLFGITHLGTPVIVSGHSSDPWELIHPGFVLARLSQAELDGAVRELDVRQRPSDWPDEWDEAEPYPITTALVTSPDRRITLLRDGREVLTESFLLDDDRPLGEHVLVLSAAEAGKLRWLGVTHQPDPERPLQPETSILDRLILNSATRERLLTFAHPGLTLVISDIAASPDRRSERGFVIMQSGLLRSPQPQEAPRP